MIPVGEFPYSAYSDKDVNIHVETWDNWTVLDLPSFD